MSELRIIRGFEDAWRAPGARWARPEEVLGAPMSAVKVRARLTRLVRRAPEVMVKVTGRARDAGHLRAHLDYISRRGEVEVETADGWGLRGRAEIQDFADAWSAARQLDSRRRRNTPVSLSLVLSMPKGTEAFAVRDAARSFAMEVFGSRFDYVFALHTDEPHPHVHVTVRSLGLAGQRLNPKKADLDEWRKVFARTLRQRGIAAEATPRRARGVTRKAERTPLRKIRERAAEGRGSVGRVQRAAWHDAAKVAFGERGEAHPWELKLVARQRRVRALYLAQARLLQEASSPEDRVLGVALARFVKEMPAIDTQRLALARVLRERSREIVNRGPARGPGGPQRSR